MPAAKKKTAKSKVRSTKKKTSKTAKRVASKTASKKSTAKKKASAKKTSTASKAKRVVKKVAKKVAKKVKATAKAKSSAAPRPTSSAGASDILLFHGMKPYQPKKGEDYMSDEQVEHFRALLKAWKQELMEEVDRTVGHMRDEAANFPDPNDRATQESEFSLELRTRDRERKLIKKINEALMHLDEGEYGYCESCGIEIGIRRLEARPTANLCIDCKTLDEIREKQMG